MTDLELEQIEQLEQTLRLPFDLIRIILTFGIFFGVREFIYDNKYVVVNDLHEGNLALATDNKLWCFVIKHIDNDPHLNDPFINDPFSFRIFRYGDIACDVTIEFETQINDSLVVSCKNQQWPFVKNFIKNIFNNDELVNLIEIFMNNVNVEYVKVNSSTVRLKNIFPIVNLQFCDLNIHTNIAIKFFTVYHIYLKRPERRLLMQNSSMNLGNIIWHGMFWREIGQHNLSDYNYYKRGLWFKSVPVLSADGEAYEGENDELVF